MMASLPTARLEDRGGGQSQGRADRAVQETACDHRAEGDRGMQRIVRAVSFGLST